jgi:3-oxoacyl-[acyl-carrier-protein] synthase II
MIKPFQVVATGLGAVTSMGVDVEEIWEAVCSGRSAIRKISGFPTKWLATEVGGEMLAADVPLLFEKTCSLANALLIHAASRAIVDAGIDGGDPALRVGIHIANPSMPCKTQFSKIRECIHMNCGTEGNLDYTAFVQSMHDRFHPDDKQALLYPVGYLAARYGLRGEYLNMNVACASGTQVIQSALNSLYRGRSDAVLVSAVNSNIDPYYITSMSRLGALSKRKETPEGVCRPFDAGRDGFALSEGSAAMVLEIESHARRRGARIYGCIGGVGVSADGYHPTAPEPEGRGMVLAMRRALKSADCEPESIDYVNAHGTGTILNDLLETKAIKAVFKEHANRMLISSTKSMTGHLFTAAGMLEAIFSLLACRDDVAPPTINYETPDPGCDLSYVPKVAVKAKINRVLSNSFGFGGQNACLVVGKYTEG